MDCAVHNVLCRNVSALKDIPQCFFEALCDIDALKFGFKMSVHHHSRVGKKSFTLYLTLPSGTVSGLNEFFYCKVFGGLSHIVRFL